LVFFRLPPYGGPLLTAIAYNAFFFVACGSYYGATSGARAAYALTSNASPFSDISTSRILIVSRNRLGFPPFCRSNGGIFYVSCLSPVSYGRCKAIAFNAFHAFSAIHATLFFLNFKVWPCCVVDACHFSGCRPAVLLVRAASDGLCI
jgi:hypothetical protein